MSDSKRPEEPHSIGEVLGGIEEIAEGHKRVCIGDALDRFGDASFTPLLIVLPLVEISPIGGVPGVPTLIAAVIALVALQMLAGRDHVWLPHFVERRAVDGAKLAHAAHRLDRLAARVDQILGNHLDWLTEGLWVRVAAFFIFLLCSSVPPLEVIPFASSAPMLAIATFGLALLLRDGWVMLFAYLLSGGALYLVLWTFLAGG